MTLTFTVITVITVPVIREQHGVMVVWIDWGDL